MSQGSKIFLPSRALGYVSNHIPLLVRYIKSRKENLISTCVGKSFHTYSCSHFTLMSVSGLHHSDITSMAGDTYHVYTSCDNVIYAWRRTSELKHTYRGHRRPVHLLLPFGPHLLSVDEDSTVKVWDIKFEECVLELTFSNESFQISTILHPSTYINKVLFGSDQGGLQLWNINTAKLIYTFKGWGSGVTCLEQAPVIDVAGIGLANGRIVLHNLRFDETIMEFLQDWGLVTTISFRTDGAAIMATGSTIGHMVFWDLEERKVVHQLLSAHDAAVTGMQCLSNEPLILTSSPDNTLKLWIFDKTDGGPRLLRIREGHSASPSFIRFHGANGQNILSAAADSSLRIFNTRTETFNKSLGKASYNRKVSKKKGRAVEDPLRMPPIVQFTTETTREKEWDNIAAVHLGIAVVTTWSYDKIKMGDLKLLHERFNKKNWKSNIKVAATCLCLTHCGNFVIIGYSTGHVDRFNIQSGIWRQTYGDPKAHDCCVRGVATDSLNRIVVTGGSDGNIKFWFFKSKTTNSVYSIDLNEPISFFRSHRESSIIAVGLEDFSVSILDLDTRSVIRKFIGHTAQLTDATFSNDSRWLVTSALDCTIKTWDIPSGQLIDHFRLDNVCTSLSLSPTGDFLATSHVDYLGIFLWANRTLYSHVSLKAVPENSEPSLVRLPDCSTEKETEETVNEDVNEPDFISPAQIGNELITLSSLATSKWHNLLNIDVIKKRNKPKAPPKKTKSAPFFLPTVPSLTFQFDLKNDEVEDGSKLLKPSTLVSLSPFGKLLDETKTTNNFVPVVESLKAMGPSMIDFEIKLLNPESGGSVDVMMQFFKCIEYMLLSNRDFELAQAYLAVFLKSHGAVIAANDELKNYLPNIQSVQSASWARLQEKLLYDLCTVQSLKIM